MYNSQSPQQSELPSSRQLIKSTIIAILVASALLVTVVLPAEYGIDPTGVGQLLGLKKMGEIKQSLAEEIAAEPSTSGTVPLRSEHEIVEIEVDSAESDGALGSNQAMESSQSLLSNDIMSLVLEPNEGAEIKVTMAKGQEVEYSWSTDGATANFDIHGDSKAGKINYHGYSKGSAKQEKGTLIAAFDGNHGWYWRNRSPKTMTVTLDVRGAYSEILLLQ